MHDAVADLYFLVLVHERLGKIGIMAVLDRRATDERRPIRNRLLLGRSGKIFTRRENWRGGANGAHWCHVNVLRSDGDDRTGRSCVCVDERVRGDLGLIERVHNICRGIESPAVRVHVENDSGSFVALGCFHRASQKCQQRRRNFTSQWHDGHIAFVNGFAARRCCCTSKRANQNSDQQFESHKLEIESHCVSLASLPRSNEAKIIRHAWERSLRRQSSKSLPQTTSLK